jgi:hypothetical protein
LPREWQRLAIKIKLTAEDIAALRALAARDITSLRALVASKRRLVTAEASDGSSRSRPGILSMLRRRQRDTWPRPL